VTDYTRPKVTAGWIVLALLATSTLSVLAGSATGLGPISPIHSPLSASGPGSAPLGLATGPGTFAHPTEITAGMGWMGIDYHSACASCVPADPQLAVGAGYVLELANGTERVWLVNGTQVFNQSWAALFNTSSDVLANPQAQFDASSFHWFVCVEDVTTAEVLVGASLSSDPSGAWNLVAIAPTNASVPNAPLLAVDATDVVVSTNDSSPNGSFLGSQVWAANKTQLLSGAPLAPVAVGGLDSETNSLVPATTLSDSSVLYLVDDGIAASGPLQVFSLTGTPPDSVTLSAPTNFTTSLSAPPNAPENGSTNLLGVGNGAVQSAAWRSNSLWAAATVSCTPANGTQVRSCLHLWEVDTTTGNLTQDFVWSSGAGTYDFDPAVSIAVRGDLALVFGESSPTLVPSIFATGQAVTDPSGTLEAPTSLHNGTGPYSPPIGCGSGVCPFGSDFAIAFTPATNVHFWAVGVYTTRDYALDDWKTWVNQVAAWRTLPVTFNETGRPAGTAWSVTVNGATTTSTTSSLSVAEQNGTFTFLVLSPINGGPGVRFVANQVAGTFTVDAAAIVETLAFVQQYQLSSSAAPSAAGTVYPGGGWFNAGAVVSLSALAAPGYKFESWTGSGAGAYAGDANPANLVLGGPVIEEAHYWASATYPVAFTESGLPTGMNWTVTVNGLSNGSSGPTVHFNEPNGTFTYTVTNLLPGTPGVQFSAATASESFDVAGAGATLSVAYLPEYLLAATPTTPGSGVVNPSSGWFLTGTTVNLSALAAPGELFAGWSGYGTGAYNGAANPAPVVMDAPVTEEARFTSATTYPITYTESGLPPGSAWTVTTNGVRDSSTGTTVVFNEPNGNYSFGVQTTAQTPNGTPFLATPAFGVLLVAGSPVRESILFEPTAAVPTSPGTTSSTSSPSGIPIWVFGASLAAFLIVVAVLTLRSRPDTPPETVVTYVTAPSPPDWDESGLQRRGS
jgi:hypothetical protein